MELNSFHTEVAPIFGSHPVCAEPGTIRHLWFDPLKTHKTPSAAKVKCTTFTLYFSQQFFKKKYTVRPIMIFWSKHTLSGSTAPHTHSHKELRETLENTVPTITQLDTFCIDPGIQPPFPASRGLFRPLDALAGGKLGALVTVEGPQVWPVWFRARDAFSAPSCLCCSHRCESNTAKVNELVDNYPPQPARWQPIAFLTPPLCACLIATQ